MRSHAGGGAIYGIGVLGALFYFLQHSHSAIELITGIIYSVFWPGVFVYKVLELWKF